MTFIAIRWLWHYFRGQSNRMVTLSACSNQQGWLSFERFETSIFSSFSSCDSFRTEFFGESFSCQNFWWLIPALKSDFYQTADFCYHVASSFDVTGTVFRLRPVIPGHWVEITHLSNCNFGQSTSIFELFLRENDELMSIYWSLWNRRNRQKCRKK